MGIKEKMMDSMMENMSKDEKLAMMDKMMEKFFADFTPEEKQQMMQQMMPKMMGGSMNMMDMMKGMMGGMMFRMGGKNSDGSEEGSQECCSEGEAFGPTEMCKNMMASIGRSHEMAEFATPELRGLFQDWLHQIEEEILSYVNAEEGDGRKIAEHFKLSEESVIYILGKLAQQGKINFKPEKI